MNRKQMIEHIAHHVDITNKSAEATLNAIIEGITEALAQEEEVTLVGFGTFKVNHRAARTGRNPATGEDIQIAAANVPAFKAGKNLKAQVNS